MKKQNLHEDQRNARLVHMKIDTYEYTGTGVMYSTQRGALAKFKDTPLIIILWRAFLYLSILEAFLPIFVSVIVIFRIDWLRVLPNFFSRWRSIGAYGIPIIDFRYFAIECMIGGHWFNVVKLLVWLNVLRQVLSYYIIMKFTNGFL